MVSDSPTWQPLNSIQRRVLGVLVEKAKTTPDQYPLTLNSLRNGCNQKSNRFPTMSFEEHQVEEALEQLRAMGAVVEVQGDARVPKHRHQMYPWLGVEKTELAVMTELLLRGAQTLGELRGRAARMEPIAGVSALRPILDSLEAKRLIVYLTPAGRGCIVTHNLYKPREMEKLCAEYGTSGNASPSPSEPQTESPSEFPTESPSAAPASITSCRGASNHPMPENRVSEDTESGRSAFNDSSAEINRLSEQLEQQREKLIAHQSETEEQLSALRTEVEDIKRQLGI